jgi:hypothetical protein
MKALEKLPQETRQALFQKAVQEHRKNQRLKENPVNGGLVE